MRMKGSDINSNIILQFRLLSDKDDSQCYQSYSNNLISGICLIRKKVSDINPTLKSKYLETVF